VAVLDLIKYIENKSKLEGDTLIKHHSVGAKLEVFLGFQSTPLLTA
jgi:hypothetical protein